MHFNNKLTATLLIGAACATASAQISVPDGIVELCDSLSDGAGLTYSDHAANGNLYVFPDGTNGDLLTSIKYLGDATPPVITTYDPSIFSGGVTGSTAFAGNTLVFGKWNSRNAPDFDTVSLQLYTLDSSTGDLTESQSIHVPTNADRSPFVRPALSAEPGQFAISGGYVAGASSFTSTVYIYREDSSGWTLDGSFEGIADKTIKALAIEGDTLIMGFSNETVHMYVRDSALGWVYDQNIPIASNDVLQSWNFGQTMEISGNLIAISDPRAVTDDTQLGENANSGAVFIYDYTNGVVTHSTTLIEHDGSSNASESSFGNSLDFSADGSSLAVCAQNFDVFSNEYWQSGVVFQYDTSDFSAYDEMYYDGDYELNSVGSFALSAQFSGSNLTVWARNFTGGNCSNHTPAFLIYENAVGIQPCNAADLASPNGVLNFFDVSAFLALFNASDPAADFNNDGVINFFDISSFLQIYNSGCP